MNWNCRQRDGDLGPVLAPVNRLLIAKLLTVQDRLEHAGGRVVGSFVRPEDMRQTVLVSSDLERHVETLAELAALGFDTIALHHVGQELDPFIDAFGDHVLPRLR